LQSVYQDFLGVKGANTVVATAMWAPFTPRKS
jgi:hypothetical protein